MRTFLCLLFCQIFISGYLGAQRTNKAGIVQASDSVYYRFVASHLEKSTDAGQSWDTLWYQQKMPDGQILSQKSSHLPFVRNRNMYWLDAQNGFLFGDDGTYFYSAAIMRTEDGGKTWTFFSAENISGTGIRMRRIHQLDEQHFVAFLGIAQEALVSKKDKRQGIFCAWSEDGGFTWGLSFAPLSNQEMQSHGKASGPDFSISKNGKGKINYLKKTWHTQDWGKTWKK